MTRALTKFNWDRFVVPRFWGQFRVVAGVAMVSLAPILAIITYMSLGVFGHGADSDALRLILLANTVYIILVAGLILSGVGRMIMARRRHSIGSRLHIRLTMIFAVIALLPTILVAIFAVLTVNMGLEGWFSDRVRTVVGNSLAAAEAYKEESQEALVEDGLSIALFLNQERERQLLLTDSELRTFLTQGQSRIQRGIREAYVIDSSANIIVRGEKSYLFDFEAPTAEQLAEAANGAPVVIEDWGSNEFRVLIRLHKFLDHYVLLSREVNGKILDLVDETKEAVLIYNQLESERGQQLFQFAIIYLGFAILLILAAIWVGMWFAERLARPIGDLAGAAQRVGGGDLDVRVGVISGDDELSMLGRFFNQMTARLKMQRQNLLENTEQIERRRRMFDSVLSSVTGGVIGLRSDGDVSFVNRAATKLLHMGEDEMREKGFMLAVPEFQSLLEQMKSEDRELLQRDIRLLRRGRQENLLVKIARLRADGGLADGFVITFDDVTELVSAQRLAAWGDVARRIAHEIKNPLTPIQLSAGRIKSKFGKVEGVDVAALEQYTDVIIRQTNDLRRIVDEFSRFARMPEPQSTETDIKKLLQDAVFLQQQGQQGIDISLSAPDDDVTFKLDPSMISQAMTNLIKNAGEAVENYQKTHQDPTFKPQIRVEISRLSGGAEIKISDNGSGWPADRSHLFEPYVTTRKSGTGLGLAIVKKIIEDHNGQIALLDALPFSETDPHFGAMVRIFLPQTVHSDGIQRGET